MKAIVPIAAILAILTALNTWQLSRIGKSMDAPPKDTTSFSAAELRLALYDAQNRESAWREWRDVSSKMVGKADKDPELEKQTQEAFKKWEAASDNLKRQ